MNILEYNRKAWDGYVEKKNQWTIPVTKKQIDNARKGKWEIVLTPTKKVPKEWFPDLKGKKILCLASGGGQQAPILAAAGAEVTVFDNSPKQLEQDKRVAHENNLKIKTVQGDMRHLIQLKDKSYDLIFNPCSVTFVDNVLPVWKEAFRVLKQGGILMTGFHNPVNLLFDLDKYEKGIFTLKYAQPYSDIHSLTKKKLQYFLDNNEPLIWGHSLTDLIGGQLKTGFRITDMYEDGWGGSKPIDKFFPSFIATRAIKL